MECVNYNDLGSNFDAFHGDNQGEENIFSRLILWKNCEKKTNTYSFNISQAIGRSIIPWASTWLRSS